MNNRLRFCLVILGALCVANFAWHLWLGWNLITIDANGASIATVIGSIEKQAGIRLRTNLPSETTVTMHVRKASLLHALEVLAASTDANWNVTYVTAPDKGSIENALAGISSGKMPEGWKRFAAPGMRGPAAEFDQGVSDPRQDPWKAKPASEGTLHAYLQQAAFMTTAQFWAPEVWNPNVPTPPKEAPLHSGVPKLAKAVHGYSAEVFVLRGRPQMRDIAATDQEPETPNADAAARVNRGRAGGPPSEEMRQALEERLRAQIDRLPKEQRTAALAELDERKKFFEEISLLSPEERRAKMAERMEQAMSNAEVVARMEAGSTKRSAMQTADQRAQRSKSYLDRKRQASN
jgi:hypothetical protein